MRRNWKQMFGGVTLMLAVAGSSLAAGGHHFGVGNGGGGFKPGGGNGGMQVSRSTHLPVQSLQSHGPSGINLNTLGGSKVMKGNGGIVPPNPSHLPQLPSGNKTIKPINLPGGVGNPINNPINVGNKIPIKPNFPIKPTFPGPIVTLPCPIKPICPVKPICPPYNPCKPCWTGPWWGGWCYNPCPPIIIPIGGGFGGYGGGYGPSVVTETVVVEAAAPAVVASEPAVTVESPVKEEKLMQVPVGATLTLEGKELGDKGGQVLLQFEKFSFPAQVNEWKPDHVTATLPLMGLSSPTKAQIFVLKDGGEVATTLAVELIPAKPAEMK